MKVAVSAAAPSLDAAVTLAQVARRTVVENGEGPAAAPRRDSEKSTTDGLENNRSMCGETDCSAYEQRPGEGRREVMKKLASVLAVFTAFLVFGAVDSVAQPGRGGAGRGGGGGWGAGTAYGRIYNPATVETVRGVVASVEHFTPAKGVSYGVHAIVKTERETIPVHLGPGWFLENQDTLVAAGDALEVKGSRITYEGRPAIVAAAVTRGDDVLTLRDARGIPVWSGWRRR